MTSQECPTVLPSGSTCQVPLMRSKDGGYSFCALCNPPPAGRSAWDPAPVGSSGSNGIAGIRSASEEELEAEIDAVQRRLRGEARGN